MGISRQPLFVEAAEEIQEEVFVGPESYDEVTEQVLVEVEVEEVLERRPCVQVVKGAEEAL